MLRFYLLFSEVSPPPEKKKRERREKKREPVGAFGLNACGISYTKAFRNCRCAVAAERDHKEEKKKGGRCLSCRPAERTGVFNLVSFVPAEFRAYLMDKKRKKEREGPSTLRRSLAHMNASPCISSSIRPTIVFRYAGREKGKKKKDGRRVVLVQHPVYQRASTSSPAPLIPSISVLIKEEKREGGKERKRGVEEKGEKIETGGEHRQQGYFFDPTCYDGQRRKKKRKGE